jgi:hypothetical protein
MKMSKKIETIIHVIGSPRIITVFSVLFVILFTIFFPIRFETNDDPVMLLISSGALFGTPDEHLIFINTIIGHLLKFLYIKIPHIEHYSIFLISCHALGFSSLMNEIVKGKLNHINKIINITIFVVFETILLANLQFTTTSALITTAGVFLILNKNRLHILLGIIFIALGFAIRLHACALVLIICTPYVVYEFYAEKIKLLKLTFLIGMVFCSLYLFDSRSYSNDKEWSFFKEYNIARSKINDNPNFKKLTPLSDSEKVNFDLLKAFMLDAQIHNLNYLNELSVRIDELTKDSAINNVIDQLRKYDIILILVFLLGCFAAYQKNKLSLYLFLASFMLFLLALMYTGIMGYIKIRVFYAALLPILFLILVNSDLLTKNNRSLLFIRVLFSLMIIKHLTSITYNTFKFISNDTRQVEQMELISNFTKKSSNPLLIWSSSLSFSSYNPMSLSTIFESKNIHLLGWLSGIPLEKDLKSHRNLIDKRFCIFIGNQNMEQKLLVLKKSLLHNYKIAIETEIELSSKNYSIIHFKN